MYSCQQFIFQGKKTALHIALDKVFNNGPSKNCGRQPLKKLKAYGLL